MIVDRKTKAWIQGKLNVPNPEKFEIENGEQIQDPTGSGSNFSFVRGNFNPTKEAAYSTWVLSEN